MVDSADGRSSSDAPWPVAGESTTMRSKESPASLEASSTIHHSWPTNISSAMPGAASTSRRRCGPSTTLE